VPDIHNAHRQTRVAVKSGSLKCHTWLRRAEFYRVLIERAKQEDKEQAF
jgi:hypothetical protein